MSKAKLVSVMLGASAFLAAPLATAQDANYPDKPVKVVVAVSPGGSVDMVARLLGQNLAQELGQPFVVENRPGASGFIGLGAAAKAPADGYTLTLAPAAFMATNKSVFKSMPYDSERDFSPISRVVNQSMVLVVRSNSSIQSVADLITEARNNPGKLTYGTAGDGSPHHLTAVLFEAGAKVRMTPVPYKGGAPALADLLAGNIDVMFQPLPEALPYVRSGRLRPLGLLADKRSTVAPEIPTMREVGAGDLQLSAWMGLFAPAGTHPVVIERLNRAVAKVLAGSARVKLLEAGLEPAPTTPQELRLILSADIKQHAELARAAGITPQ